VTVPTAAVELRLPVDWIEVDPRSADLAADLAGSIRSTWDVDPHDEVLGPVVLHLRRLAADPRIVLAGLYCRVLTVDGLPEPLILTANVVLAVSGPDTGLDVAAGAARPGWETTPADLPAGPAVVSTGEVTLSGPEQPAGQPITAWARRYFVPVPGQDRLVTLAFLTPHLDLAEEFGEVFDAVAGTLEFSG
jgi:hypothetical protein